MTTELREASVLPLALSDAVPSIATDAIDAAFKAIADGLRDRGYEVTGDFAPDEVGRLNHLFSGFVLSMALNNPEIAAMQDDPEIAGVNTWAPVLWEVSGLEVTEPAALADVEGVEVFVTPQAPPHGWRSAIVRAATRQEVLDYVRENWGDDDAEWYGEAVVGGVTRVPGKIGETPKVSPFRKLAAVEDYHRGETGERLDLIGDARSTAEISDAARLALTLWAWVAENALLVRNTPQTEERTGQALREIDDHEIAERVARAIHLMRCGDA